MKEIAPRYLRDFKCIASDCRHSCCIGWEIDIDENSLENYRAVQGEFGKRLAENIVYDGETAFFRLGKDERCPFLNDCGLCDIYTELGEEALCQICTDHPRFRNYFSDRTELGLGLCCEAAAKLILAAPKEKWELDTLWEDGEEEKCTAFEHRILSLRERLFTLLQGGKPICEIPSAELPKLDWCAVLRELEQLDPRWDKLLFALSEASSAVWEAEMNVFDAAFRNLLLYFLYRHLPGAADERDIAARVRFAYLGYRIVRALCANKENCTFDDLLEFCRLYSSEIEYSEENTEMLLAILKEVL